MKLKDIWLFCAVISTNLVSSHAYAWVNTVPEPYLTNPKVIELSDGYPTRLLADYDRVGCEGKYHYINLSSKEDAIIRMKRGSRALKYPVWVTGGRNVHILGIEGRPIVQPGCDVGEGHQVRDVQNKNIHPRMPGNKFFRLQQSGTTYIEGVDIDLKGLEADCFAIRNASGMSNADAIANRKVYIINTRCTGIEGLDESAIGDGIHGDFFQNQGKDDLSELILENITIKSSSNGVTFHKWNSKKPKLFKIQNFNYAADMRYEGDDRFDGLRGLAFTGHGERTEFSSVWINHIKGLNYGIVNGQRLGAKAYSNVKKESGFYAGNPPGGDFAKESDTGLQYVRSGSGTGIYNNVSSTSASSGSSGSATSSSSTSGTSVVIPYSPTPNTRVTTDIVEFKWQKGSVSAVNWWVKIGKQPGGMQYFDSGRLGSSSASVKVNSLPHDGSRFYVELSYKNLQGVWISKATGYYAVKKDTVDEHKPIVGSTSGTSSSTSGASSSTSGASSSTKEPVSSSGVVTMASPAPNTRLNRGIQTFKWSSDVPKVTNWYVRVGSKKGGSDIFDSGHLSARNSSVIVKNIPREHSKIYVELSYKNSAGEWVRKLYEYK